MDEPVAWLQQAISERAAADRLLGGANGAEWCHVIAKYQQTVEKAIKAMVAALRDHGVLSVTIGYQHPVEPFVSMLIRLRRDAGNRGITSHLRRLLDHNTRDSIRSLDALVPRRPPPGEPHRRNTEYPFQDSASQWTCPAVQGAFSLAEVQKFRDLSHRIANGASQMISTIRHAPK